MYDSNCLKPSRYSVRTPTSELPQSVTCLMYTQSWEILLVYIFNCNRDLQLDIIKDQKLKLE